MVVKEAPWNPYKSEIEKNALETGNKEKNSRIIHKTYDYGAIHKNVPKLHD